MRREEERENDQGRGKRRKEEREIAKRTRESEMQRGDLKV